MDSTAVSLSLKQQLDIEQTENSLSAISGMFADDDDSTSSESESSSAQEEEIMEEYLFELFEEEKKENLMQFSIFQSSTAFGSSGIDQTGNVVWGASLYLCNYLASSVKIVSSSSSDDTFISSNESLKNGEKVTTISNKAKVLELGCGSALASLVIATQLRRFNESYNNESDECCVGSKVVATDYEINTLELAKKHVLRNDLSEMIDVVNLDWDNLEDAAPLLDGVTTTTTNNNNNDDDSDIGGFQMIIASDVIYGTHMVLPLVKTIDRFLTDETNGIVIIATRDGRRGIHEFRQAMTSLFQFEEIKSINYLGKDREESSNQIMKQQNNILNNFKICRVNDLSTEKVSDKQDNNIPDCFDSPAHISRWKADHSIYLYRRCKKNDDSV